MTPTRRYRVRYREAQGADGWLVIKPGGGYVGRWESGPLGTAFFTRYWPTRASARKWIARQQARQQRKGRKA